MPLTTTVYRVETEDGTGPFKIGFLNRTTVETFRVHPCPWEDEKLKKKGIHPWRMSEYYCGLSSLEQYEKWFGSNNYFLNDPATKKLVLSKYEVPIRYVRAGKTQVLFKKEKATKREVIRKVFVE